MADERLSSGMFETPWKKINPRYRIRARYGFDRVFARRNNQEPHFSLTGETERMRGSRWMEESGGQIPNLIRRHFLKLKPLVKWHLVTIKGVPMHYEANAMYWFDQGSLANFKSTIVFGVLKEDSANLLLVGADKPLVRQWLKERLPKLRRVMRRDMKRAGVL